MQMLILHIYKVREIFSCQKKRDYHHVVMSSRVLSIGYNLTYKKKIPQSRICRGSSTTQLMIYHHNKMNQNLVICNLSKGLKVQRLLLLNIGKKYSKAMKLFIALGKSLPISVQCGIKFIRRRMKFLQLAVDLRRK